MATFEATRSQFSQEHFEVVEIDLPVITGTCTLGGSAGFGTPLTCDEAYTGEIRTYKFTNEDAPIVPGAFRYIKSISETTAEIKPGSGLASRGSLTISFNDAIGDPNRDAPAVTEAVINQGTFFGKLDFRQIITNKEVRVKLYRVEEDGTIDLVNGALTRYYVGETFRNNGKTWTLTGKDELSVVDINEKVWPLPQDGFLRQAADDVQLFFLVDDGTDYSAAEVVMIGDEFVRVDSVVGNLTPAATILTLSRGADIVGAVSGKVLSKTVASDHDAGDQVYICVVDDNKRIDDRISEILTDVDVDPARIPTTAWQEEIDAWWPDTFINTLWYSSEDVNETLSMVLTDFLTDIVFDPEDRLINLFAISVWKQSVATLTEGEEIIIDTPRLSPNENIRATRALVVYDKPNLTDNNDTSSYTKGSTFENLRLQGPEFYGEHKDFRFDNSHLLDTDSANLLTQRWVSRFGTKPKDITVEIPESKLNVNVGQVVDLRLLSDQGADGLPNKSSRGQIVKINPKYKDGRTYMVKFASYEAVALSGSEYVLNDVGGLNLYGYAGNPPDAVNVTFIIDTTRTSSPSTNTPSFFAGNFVVGSKLTIIFVNGSEGQSKGGDGGSIAVDGGFGGTVYDAQGVDTDIYLSGDTPSANFPAADGFIHAPGGGGGGGGDNIIPIIGRKAGAPGGGGAGDQVGLAGVLFEGATAASPGTLTGTGGAGGIGEDPAGDGGDGGDWGQDGQDGQDGNITFPNGIGGSGGLAGKGILTGGAQVNLYDILGGRLINGSGDTPGNPLQAVTPLIATTEMGDFS